MKHFYDISRGQLITAWVFGVVFCLFQLSPALDYGRQWAISLLIFVPFFLTFYTIGWFKRRKRD